MHSLKYFVTLTYLPDSLALVDALCDAEVLADSDALVDALCEADVLADSDALVEALIDADVTCRFAGACRCTL